MNRQAGSESTSDSVPSEINIDRMLIRDTRTGHIYVMNLLLALALWDTGLPQPGIIELCVEEVPESQANIES